MSPLQKTLLLAVAFLALTIAGIAWALHAGEVDLAAIGAQWQAWPIGVRFAGAAMALAVLGLDALRYRVVGAALGVHVPWRAAFDAMVANFFFAWITPGSAMADPAAVYMLGRRGVPWDAATLIAFGKMASGNLVIFGPAVTALALGLGPDLGPGLGVFLLTGGAFVLLTFAVPVIGALWPERLTGFLDRVAARLRRWLPGPRAGRVIGGVQDAAVGAVHRLARFRAHGFPGVLQVAAVHAVYYSVFIGLMALLALAGGADPPFLTGARALLYQVFTYVAPTPGGAGLSEATAGLFFGDLMPAGAAVGAVLGFRALTFYLHIVIGAVYLPIIGGLSAIWAQRRPPINDM